MDIFPIRNLPPGEFQWYPQGSYSDGGEPISGFGQTADHTLGGGWVCEYQCARLGKRGVQLLRALLTDFMVADAYFVMPVLDACQPWAAGQRGPATPVGFDDGATFSGGALFDGALIEATLAADAYAPTNPAPPVAPTVAQIAFTAGGPPIGGEFYSLIGPSTLPRLYTVGRITGVSGSTYTISSGPPFREDYASGTQVAFDKPACVMRLDLKSLKGMWPKMEAGFSARPLLRFIEAFPSS